ncbi:hypothetical protein GFS31_40890 (plasmid) [Leptolyngbya sp. BL0902]|uniref:hypothetical protein n=1 Tax=Leptolyngbya sp. BL0902 TaxID=1115757 RepID=UPI0018E7C79C|nr:hypothetical protein [Leptolyngbya sp. BL0902]QQE67376.1 hypothetical protein GFS31_40890 [Leptolyngbya sp. BL0902]
MTPEDALKALKAEHEALGKQLEETLPSLFNISVDEVVDFQPAGPDGGVVGLLRSGEQYYQFTLANGRKVLQEVEVEPTN